jgi:hypothetical protein
LTSFEAVVIVLMIVVISLGPEARDRSFVRLAENERVTKSIIPTKETVDHG